MFFESIHQLHESLDTWKILADHDVSQGSLITWTMAESSRCWFRDLFPFFAFQYQITPSERVTYSRAEMVKALASGTEYQPYVR